MRNLWLAFGLSLVCSLVLTVFLTPQVSKLAFKYGAIAKPRERDIHRKDLPRWGGLAMFGGFGLTLALIFVYSLIVPHVFPWTPHQLTKLAGVLIAATMLVVVGALDDKFEISALWQTLALIAAGIILILFGVRVDGLTNPFTAGGLSPHDPRRWLPLPMSVSVAFTIIWVFGVAKTVDFIDGLDGLAAGVCAICGTTLALMSAHVGQYGVTIIAAALVGSCLGFLRYNYNPATIIMGTVGAQFLGFVLAAISIIGTFKIAATLSVALPLLVLGVPIFDGIRVVASRVLKGRPALVADRTSHIHHLLINRGFSQRKAVWMIYGLTAGLCAIAFVLFRASGR